MKKILLSARDLNIGGIEKALVNLCNYLIEEKYKVTLVLQKKDGDLLNELNDNIKIITYTPSNTKVTILRKFINLCKRIKFSLKYKNKFDLSISFATYLKSGSYVARTASKNSILWCHADYLSLYSGNKEKMENFFEDIYYDEFSKIVFVSQKGKETFESIFPEQKNVYFCNNLIDYKDIYKKTEEKIDLKYNEKIVTFLNVGRHDEKQKRLTRIIQAAEKLEKEKYNFRIIFVGSGQDTEKYKNEIKEKGLGKNIIFKNATKNPYPYYKISNCVILSSDYEGYPIVFLESFVLNRPIITTDVSDYKEVENGRGIVVQKNVDSIYKAMKNFIENGYVIKNQFDIRKYNKEVKESLNEILKN